MTVCNQPIFMIPPMTRVKFSRYRLFIELEYMSETVTRQPSSYKMLLTSITTNESSWKVLGIKVDSVFIIMTLFLSVSNYSRKSKLFITAMLQRSSKIDGRSIINMTSISLESIIGLKSNQRFILSILLTYDDLNGFFLSYLFHD